MNLLSLPPDLLFLHLFTSIYFDPVTLTICRFISRYFNARLKYKANRDVLTKHAPPFPLLKWITPSGRLCNEDLLAQYARRNQREVLQWYTNKYGTRILDTKNKEILNHAIMSGNIELVEWVYRYITSLSEKQLISAVMAKNIEIVKWLFDHDCPIPTELMDTAIRMGNLHIIECLRLKGFELSTRHYSQANNDIDVLEYLYQHEVPFGRMASIFIQAVYKNDLACVKWGVEHNVPSDRFAVSSAIGLERVAILEYLLEHRYPYDRKQCLDMLQDVKNPRIRQLIENDG